MSGPRAVAALLAAAITVTTAIAAARAEDGLVVLPRGKGPAAIATPHFPDHVHAFVFRNWGLVSPERLAQVLGADAASVRALAESMGLAPDPVVLPHWRERGYITLIRRNWHLLPYEQLLVLLDWSAERLAETLREDDFLFVKLGNLKPSCDPLAWSAPSEAARARAAEIAEVVRGFRLRAAADGPEEPRFAFLERWLRAPPPAPARNAATGSASPRFLYSYAAVYGDPLLDAELRSWPEGYLAELAASGVNGFWVHIVLRQLAPSPLFGDGDGRAAERLANLRRLIARAAAQSLKVYLYLNEPRAMPEAFFAGRDPALRGVREGEHFALCTSRPQVRNWIEQALAEVFRAAPGLGGVFSITASENLTSCASHYRQGECPQCKSRAPEEIIAELIGAITAGVRAASPAARVMAWDWGWQDGWAPALIARLPEGVALLSVSEWSQPFRRGGVESAVGEYSLSVVGPGPRARRHWQIARDRGLPAMAKLQLNATWELSALPYLPVLDLVAMHLERLGRVPGGIDGALLGWTLGGHPSPTLELAAILIQSSPAGIEAALDRVAEHRFGAGADAARAAWREFSCGFSAYPYDGGVIYNCPVQMGPANLLFARPSGFAATMVGLPYDDLRSWRGPYSAEAFAAQFEAVADGWERGLTPLRRAVELAPESQQRAARAELRFAAAALHHFRSVAQQARFVAARDALLSGGDKLRETESAALRARLRDLVEAEFELARRHYRCARQDSRIGFEASNHYFYVPQDLIEKGIACRHLLASDALLSAAVR